MEKLIEHYKKIYESQNEDFRNSNLRKMILKKLKTGRILDIGCGPGHLTLDILKNGYNDVTAIDKLQEMVNFTKFITKLNGYETSIEKIDAEDLIEKFNSSSFDCVLLIDVMEHIQNDNKVLKNTYSLLKTGGIMILTVPAYRWCYGIRDKEIGHFRRYNKEELLRKILNADFKVNEVRFWNFISLVPYVFFEKILGKRVNENIRYSKKKTYFFSGLNWFLNKWFLLIENRFSFGIGLSLFIVAQKPNNQVTTNNKKRGNYDKYQF